MGRWEKVTAGRAFTLVEAAVVVVIIGVIAAIASVTYIRHRRAARMHEATHLVAAIRAEQEAYRQEKGTYATVSKGVDAFYPAANPGRFATPWGGPCDSCVDPSGWKKLGVRPAEPVVYGYATVAGVGADVGASSGAFTSSGGGTSGSTNVASSGAPDDDDAPSAGNDCTAIAPTQPYFIIKAKGDTDGDGIASTVLALSCTNQLVVTNEGE